MDLNIKRRVLEEANSIIKTKMTIRELSKYFKVSKSTVHKDLSERLKKVDEELYEQVEVILKTHFDERHIRGGEMTRLRYRKKREDNG